MVVCTYIERVSKMERISIRERQSFDKVLGTVASPQAVLLYLAASQRTPINGFGIDKFIKGRVILAQ